MKVTVSYLSYILLIFAFGVIPLLGSIILGLNILAIYSVFFAAFVIYFIPGFALTSFIKKLSLFERLSYSFAAGVFIVPLILTFIGIAGFRVDIYIATVFIAIFAGIIAWKKFYKLPFQKNEGTNHLDLYDVLASLVVVLVFLFLLTPIFSLPVPYGDIDAGLHYVLSEYIFQNHMLPVNYPDYQTVYQGKFGYPPIFHIGSALIAQLSNVDFLFSFYINVALLHAIMILSFYSLIRKYYGNLVGLLSTTLAAISLRFMFPLIFGQLAFYVGLVAFPFALFLTKEFFDRNEKVHATILGLIIAATFYANFQVTGMLMTFFIVYFALFYLRNRKLPSNVWLIFLVLIISIPAIFLKETFDVTTFSKPINQLYIWYPDINVSTYFGGYPYQWYNPILVYQYVLIPTVLGIAVWLKFFRKDLIVPSLFLSILILIHLPVEANRIGRMFTYEGFLVALLAGLGLISIQLISHNRKLVLASSFVALLAIATFSFYVTSNTVALFTSFRLTPEQFGVLSQFKNLPEGLTGQLGFDISPVYRTWVAQIPHKHIYSIAENKGIMNDTKYILLTEFNNTSNTIELINNLSTKLLSQGCNILIVGNETAVLSTNCLTKT